MKRTTRLSPIVEENIDVKAVSGWIVAIHHGIFISWHLKDVSGGHFYDTVLANNIPKSSLPNFTQLLNSEWSWLIGVGVEESISKLGSGELQSLQAVEGVTSNSHGDRDLG